MSNTVSNGATNAFVTAPPTRPDPTRPISGYVSHPSSLSLKGRPTMDDADAIGGGW